jgi:MtrB/PioB family decaheme-associated outer membrane protein
MRNTHVAWLVALALLPAAVSAQTPTTPPGTSPGATPPGDVQPGGADPALGARNAWTGTFDFGLRTSSVEGDRGRFERYRDLGDGLFLEGVRVNRDTGTWLFGLQAEHVGRRDQRYTGSAVLPGKLKASFMWDQIPMLLSRRTRTLFSGVGTGELRIDDAIQALGQAQPTAITDAFKQSSVGFLTTTRRHIALGRIEYEATPDLTLRANVRHTNRDGTIPSGGSFGHSSLVELPAPTRHTLTDFDAAAEFARNGWLLRAGSTGSWFHNDVTSVIFDNPFRFTDTPTASSAGRLALQPSSSMIGVNGLASVRLPYRSRVTAFASVGVLKDAGDPLIPITINPLVQTSPLERSYVDGEAGISSANLRFVSRPNRFTDIQVQFRNYEYDNRTPEFHLKERVSFDNAPTPLNPPVHTEPFSVHRRTLDADFRYLPTLRTSVGLGFTRIGEERTHRIFDSTTDNQVRVTFDAMSRRWFSLRTKYEHAERRGEGIERGEAFLASIGEQPGMRHFDIAARDRDRFTLTGTVTPTAFMVTSLSMGVGKDDYFQSLFGMRDNTHRVYGAGTDVVIGERANAGISYSFEQYDALSRSRQANPGAQFTDPSRNWAADTTDRTHSLVLDAGVARIAERVDLQVSYDFMRGRAFYDYITGPVLDRTLPEEVVVPTTLPTPSQLPPMLSELQRGTVDVIYALTSRIGVGFSYWHERYRVRDFTLDIDANPDAVRGQALFLGYMYEPYTANTGWVRLVYRW